LFTFVFFILISAIISWIDIKTSLIPDKIILPAIAAMVFLLFIEGTLDSSRLLAAAVVLAIFIVPVVLNLAFGGGDLRFGIFCALLVGLEGIGYFIALSGALHLLLLLSLRKSHFGFAPAMSTGALITYGVLHA